MPAKIVGKELVTAEEADGLMNSALERPVNQESDIAAVIKNLNEDIIETHSKLPSIDMKTRLHPMELTSIVVHDTIVALNCLPEECLVTTRVKKRLAVSLNGQGREEIVKIVQGEREHDKEKAGGFLGSVKNMFTQQ